MTGSERRITDMKKTDLKKYTDFLVKETETITFEIVG